jgi:NAD(P) transhydrogenase subunit alpha
MKIGIPKERREHEQRVAGSADTVKRYKGVGLEAVVERGAGAGAAIPDQAFTDAGATLVDDPGEVWASEIVLAPVSDANAPEKVKGGRRTSPS